MPNHPDYRSRPSAWAAARETFLLVGLLFLILAILVALIWGVSEAIAFLVGVLR